MGWSSKYLAWYWCDSILKWKWCHRLHPASSQAPSTAWHQSSNRLEHFRISWLEKIGVLSNRVRNCFWCVFPFCFFGICCSVCFPCNLQHFGAGSCHFNGIATFCRGYLRLFLLFGCVSLGLFRVGLGCVWGKFQILGCLRVYLKFCCVFWGWCGGYLGLF